MRHTFAVLWIYINFLYSRVLESHMHLKERMTHQKFLCTKIWMCQSLFNLNVSNRNFRFVISIVSKLWQLTVQRTTMLQCVIFEMSSPEIIKLHHSDCPCILFRLGTGSYQWDMLSLRRWSQVRLIICLFLFMWATACPFALFLCFNSLDLKPNKPEWSYSEWVTYSVWTDTRYVSWPLAGCVCLKKMCIVYPETLPSSVIEIQMMHSRKESIRCFGNASRRQYRFSLLIPLLPSLLTIDHGTAELVVLFWLKPVSLACLSCAGAWIALFCLLTVFFCHGCFWKKKTLWGSSGNVCSLHNKWSYFRNET